MPHKHLSAEERSCIEIFLGQDMSSRDIAAALNRAHSSITREIRRNRSLSGYRGQTAQKKADTRRKQPRHFRRQEHDPLVKYVDKKLRNDWSPEQIANRIQIDYPDDDRMRISVEAIYAWVYTATRQGSTIHKHLRRGRSRRRQQKLYGKGKRFFPERVGIADRPEEVTSRERFGDWEGDMVSGSSGKPALATCVERKSRFLVAARTEDKTAASFNAAITAEMRLIPEDLRKTLTVDNGSEMACFKELEAQTGLTTYFCDAHSPWQRGTNENFNGLLRQYFPRGTTFRSVKEEAVQKAVDRLNNRPRKCLDYRTPAEVFATALAGAFAT
ncbi:transposase InsI for insertion sequence element IS30A [Geomonas sp. Red276]